MGLIMITAVKLHAATRAMSRHPSRSTASQRGGVFVRLLVILMVVAVLAASAAGAWAWRWVNQPLPLRQDVVELSVEPGMTPRGIAQAWVDAGIDTSPVLLYQWFRWSGQARQIKAGSYETQPGMSARRLLRMMVQGDESLSTVKLIEGWTFKRWRQELAAAEGLVPDSLGMSDEAIMRDLGGDVMAPEGQFFPDTYAYAKGSSDLAVMKRAHKAMQRQLALAWAQRAPDLALQTPEQVLIMASIVEKETGHEADRGLVSAVFNNRLRIGMPLQTDPTVIYGLGDAFDGNLRKVHLQTDTPFNTYTRRGLPPTPIAMPGKAALLATVRPDQSKALYFVAQGNGRSTFSETLNEHNRAVNRYQRNQP
jgi:UPF0755 protein